MTVLLRRAIGGHLHCSRPRKILNVFLFQGTRFRFFWACGLACGLHLNRLVTKAMSDRLLQSGNSFLQWGQQLGTYAESTTACTDCDIRFRQAMKITSAGYDQVQFLGECEIPVGVRL